MKKNLENEEVVFDARKNMRFIRNLGAKIYHTQNKLLLVKSLIL